MNYNPPELDYKPIFLKAHILPTYIKPRKQRNYKQKRVNGIFWDLTKNTV